MKVLVAYNSPRSAHMLGDCRDAANDDLAEFLERMRDEYDSGLDLVPTRRMERDDPERWEEQEGSDEK